jgi:ABC-2 type transport system ATP-binding protein
MAAAPRDAGAVTAIELRDVTVVRGGRPVLSDISLRCDTGSLVGLVGPSGSGKTTLMRALVGVQRNVTGSVLVLGRVAGDASLRRRVGYVTQAPSVYDDLSVVDNLRFFGRLLDVREDAVARTISDVGLDDVARQRVDHLSGGQRARVSLATALLGEPDLLVLDEPTVGLDPVLRNELWRLFRGLVAAVRTVLVSSHVMDEAGRCDRVLLLRDGQVLADASPTALLEHTGSADLDAAFLELIRRAS